MLKSLYLSRRILPAFFIVLLVACERSPEPLHLSGATMGTRYHITWLPSTGSPTGEAVHVGVEAVLEDVNASMSTYRPDSEISLFNESAPGTWYPVTAGFMEVFLLARQVSEASDGAYDVTVQPLVNLWGFGPSFGEEVPAEAAIAAALGMVGQSWIEVDTPASALLKKRPVELDFSSIAKGYGVDRVAQWLLGRGIENFLVEIGGEIRVAGHSPRGTPWRIAVEKPEALDTGIVAALALADAAVATSGDYRNYFEVDGVRYSHSIDPRTGRPVRHELVSVTVVHENTALADAWATALTILGPEQALAVATRENLAAYLISRSEDGFAVKKTPAIEPLLD